MNIVDNSEFVKRNIPFSPPDISDLEVEYL